MNGVGDIRDKTLILREYSKLKIGCYPELRDATNITFWEEITDVNTI